MSRRHLLLLLALAVVWGASFMLIKVGVEELAPSVVVLLRLVLGAATLAPIVVVRFGWRAVTAELRASARPLAAAGLLNTAVPFWTALVTALGALVAASVAMLPAGLAQLPGHAPSWKATGALLALGVGGTGLAYVLYYALIARVGASRSILITYLVPAFALVYGAAVLGEPVTAAALVGLALVLAGVALGIGAARLARRREPEPVRG